MVLILLPLPLIHWYDEHAPSYLVLYCTFLKYLSASGLTEFNPSLSPCFPTIGADALKLSCLLTLEAGPDLLSVSSDVTLCIKSRLPTWISDLEGSRSQISIYLKKKLISHLWRRSVQGPWVTLSLNPRPICHFPLPGQPTRLQGVLLLRTPSKVGHT